jgi:hypothetical protein
MNGRTLALAMVAFQQGSLSSSIVNAQQPELGDDVELQGMIQMIWGDPPAGSGLVDTYWCNDEGACWDLGETHWDSTRGPGLHPAQELHSSVLVARECDASPVGNVWNGDHRALMNRPARGETGPAVVLINLK